VNADEGELGDSGGEPLRLTGTALEGSSPFVCVTVNTALTGPVSFPSVVLTIDTVALSLSVMFAVAVRFAGVPLNVTSVLLLAIDVNVAITVSVASTDVVVQRRDRDRRRRLPGQDGHRARRNRRIVGPLQCRPVSVKFTTVFTELAFVCVAVNTPFTGPVSLPSVVLAIRHRGAVVVRDVHRRRQVRRRAVQRNVAVAAGDRRQRRDHRLGCFHDVVRSASGS